MVAGGVQSVEGTGMHYGGYSTGTSFYPQFYSTLLPQQPPSSHSAASSYTSDGTSPTRILPPARKHPQCTCPPTIQSRRPISLAVPRKPRHPRCTCPSPPPSGGKGSSWESTPTATPPVSPLSSPKPYPPRCTCPKPVRHPKCTCPHPPKEYICTCQFSKGEWSVRQHKNISRPLLTTLLRCPDDSTSISTNKGDLVKITPNAGIFSDYSDSSSARTKTKRKVREKPRGIEKTQEKPKVIGGRGAKHLSETSTTDIGVSMVSLPITPAAELFNGHPRTWSSEENLKEDQPLPNETAVESDTSSPAKRMRNKFLSLKQKVFSTLIRSAPSSPGVTMSTGLMKENRRRSTERCENIYSKPDPRTKDLVECRESALQNGSTPKPVADRHSKLCHNGIKKMAPLSALSSRSSCDVFRSDDGTQYISEGNATAKFKRMGTSLSPEGQFSLKDLPVPIVDDLVSPLGSVPPLSPGDVPSPVTLLGNKNGPLDVRLTQLDRQTTSRLYAQHSISPVAAVHTGHISTSTRGSSAYPLSSSPVLPSLPQNISSSSDSSAVALFRTRSLDITSADAQNFRADDNSRHYPPPPYMSGSFRDRSSSIRYQKYKHFPKSLGNKRICGSGSSHTRVPPSLTSSHSSSEPPSGKPCSCRRKVPHNQSLESLPFMGSRGGPQYENVVISGDGRYTMLSKKMLDRWQLSTPSPIPVVSPIRKPSATGGVVSVSPFGDRDFLFNHKNVTKHKSQHVANKALDVGEAVVHSNASSPCSSSVRSVTSSPPPQLSHIDLNGGGGHCQHPSTLLLQLATRHVGGLVGGEKPCDGETVYSDSKVSSHHKTWSTKGESQKMLLYSVCDDGDTDQETDRLLGQQRSDDTGFLDEKSWRRLKSRPAMPRSLGGDPKEGGESDGGGGNSNDSSPSSPSHHDSTNQTPSTAQDTVASNKAKAKKEKDVGKKKGRSKEVLIHEPAVLIEGVLFRARYLGSTQLVSEGQPTKTTRMMQAEEAVSRIKAPDGEAQPSTEVDLFISTEKIMVLNTDLKEIMMDHALRTISYIADIGDLVVLMARRRVLPTDEQSSNPTHRVPKMICHVFESDEAQFIAQSIGQAFQVAYLEFLKANGIEDHSFVKEMDYQEVLNSQEIFGDELQMFAKKELQKEVVVPKMKGEILGVVVVESGWGSMVPTVVIANLSPTGAAAKCGQLNIGDQIIAINGISLVGLPLSNCQNYIKNTKYNTAVKLTVVPCPPVVEVKIRRPDTKYQLGFSVQNGVICSLLRGGIAERGGVRVGHRIIDINNQSVVAVPHEKIVNLLATSVGEIRMKTMPTSIFRLLTGQESPQYI